MIDFKAKTFFDRPAVIKAAGKKRAEILSRGGAYIRRVAQTSMRRTKSLLPSPPGKPPRARKGTIRDLLTFEYDFASDSVVVGPEKFPPNTRAPHTLEFGGTIRTRRRLVRDRKTKKLKVVHQRRIRTVTIDERPYMMPALQVAKSKLAPMWEGSVRGS